MAKRILVPLDGSETAEAAAILAGDLARSSGGQVRLLQVRPVPEHRVSTAGRVVGAAGLDAGGGRPGQRPGPEADDDDGEEHREGGQQVAPRPAVRAVGAGARGVLARERVAHAGLPD